MEGNVEIVNNDKVKRQTADGIIAYPEIRIKKTSNPYKVFFIDERARNIGNGSYTRTNTT